MRCWRFIVPTSRRCANYGQAASTFAGMAHITGGGVIDNLPRILPEGIGARDPARNVGRTADFRSDSAAWRGQRRRNVPRLQHGLRNAGDRATRAGGGGKKLCHRSGNSRKREFQRQNHGRVGRFNDGATGCLDFRLRHEFAGNSRRSGTGRARRRWSALLSPIARRLMAWCALNKRACRRSIFR